MTKGFFTQGISYSLPHPKIPTRTILLICHVIRKAWNILKDNPPDGFNLSTSNEDTITQILVEIIENRLRIQGDIDGFNNALFGRVVREPKITNYDKSHPDKMPDIFFDLKREHLPVLNDQDGLFVECKPLDHNHTIYTDYFKKGLMRFVNGDYAWAMQDAMMLGYVDPMFKLSNLEGKLDETKKKLSLNTMDHGIMKINQCYFSKHARKFQWIENNGKACPISLVHLWMETN